MIGMGMPCCECTACRCLSGVSSWSSTMTVNFMPVPPHVTYDASPSSSATEYTPHYFGGTFTLIYDTDDANYIYFYSRYSANLEIGLRLSKGSNPPRIVMMGGRTAFGETVTTITSSHFNGIGSAKGALWQCGNGNYALLESNSFYNTSNEHFDYSAVQVSGIVGTVNLDALCDCTELTTAADIYPLSSDVPTTVTFSVTPFGSTGAGLCCNCEFFQGGSAGALPLTVGPTDDGTHWLALYQRTDTNVLGASDRVTTIRIRWRKAATTISDYSGDVQWADGTPDICIDCNNGSAIWRGQFCMDTCSWGMAASGGQSLGANLQELLTTTSPLNISCTLPSIINNNGLLTF